MKISIQTLLTVPFLVLTLTPIGIVGWLFYSNSQKAVEQIAGDLFNQVSDRISEQTRLYLSTPHFINQANANAIELGLLNLEDRDSVERYFVEQFRAAYQTGQDPDSLDDEGSLSSSINHIYIGTPAGEFSGAEYRPRDREDPSSNHIIAISRLENSQIVHYAANRDGIAGERLDDISNSNEDQSDSDPFILSQRRWYEEGVNLWNNRSAVAAGWSDPYCDDSTERPAITAVRPIGDPNNQLIGILGGDFLFSDIETFIENLLQNLEVNGGKIFILNPNKEVWITSESSSEEKCDPSGSGDLPLTAASSIENSIISKLVAESSPKEGLKKIKFEGQNYLWDSIEFQDSYGLKLSIFMAIPESSFTGNIDASTRYTIALSLLTLVVTALLGLLISSRITQPVLRLEREARALVDSISSGRQSHISINNPSELHALAQTFEKMSTQLKDLFVAFSHFVPQNFLDVLGLKDATEVRLGSYKRAEMTILFSDIRSFTSLCENMTPEQNFQFINSYLEKMEPAISEHHGFIDKYIGDAIMALFEGDNSPDNAVKASLGMLRNLADYNQTRTTSGRPPLKIGIGIHTGRITLGTLGGINRWDTTVIGGDVNRASRVEGLTKDFGASLLVSKQTIDVLQNTYHHRYLGAATVRGLDEPVSIYEIYEADSIEVVEGKIRTLALFQSALGLYEQKEYAQALEKFEEILGLVIEDGASKYYAKVCKKYLGQDLEL